MLFGNGMYVDDTPGLLYRLFFRFYDKSVAKHALF